MGSGQEWEERVGSRGWEVDREWEEREWEVKRGWEVDRECGQKTEGANANIDSKSNHNMSQVNISLFPSPSL